MDLEMDYRVGLQQHLPPNSTIFHYHTWSGHSQSVRMCFDMSLLVSSSLEYTARSLYCPLPTFHLVNACLTFKSQRLPTQQTFPNDALIAWLNPFFVGPFRSHMD